MVNHWWKYRIDIGLGSLLGIGILAGTAWIAQYGIVLNDEGYYLASAYNLYLGEPLFTELHSAGLRNFDYLLSFLFYVFPHLSVWDFRLLSSLAFAGMVVAWYLLFRLAGLTSWLSAFSLLTGYALWLMGLRLFDLSYITIPMVVLPWSVLIIELIRRYQPPNKLRWFGWVLAGTLLAIACIARSTMIASLLLWIILALCTRHKPVIMSVGISAGIGLVLTSLFFVLHSANWSHLQTSYAILSNNVGYGPEYKLNQLKQLGEFFYSTTQPFFAVFRWSLVFSVLMLAVWWVTKKQTKSIWIIVVVISTQLIGLRMFVWSMQSLVITIDDLTKLFSMYTWIGGFTLSAILVYALFKVRTHNATFPTFFLIVSAIVIQFLQVAFTAQSFFSWAVNFSFPVLSLCLVLFYELGRPFQLNSAAQRVLIGGYSLICCFVLWQAVHFIQSDLYADLPQAALSEQFTAVPRMGSIYSTAIRVQGTTEVVAAVQNWTEPGDFILSYYDSPLIYFLTETRPSVNTVWLSRILWTEEVNTQALQHMCQRQQFPKVIVLNHFAYLPGGLIDVPHGVDYYYTLDDDVLAKYVQDNFKTSYTYGDYTLLLPNSGIDHTKFCHDTFSL